MEIEKVKNKHRHKKGIVIRTKEEKRQIRRAKDKERKAKKKKNKDDLFIDFDHSKFSDNVKFNEVVHAPPQNLLNVENYAERRPGKQKNLLLIKKLPRKTSDNYACAKAKNSPVSLARKNVLEQERIRVIEQYRKLKKTKHVF